MQNFKILQLAQSNKIMYNIYNDQAELYAPANCISIKLIKKNFISAKERGKNIYTMTVSGA